jgi:hypothetical protein
MPFFRKAHAPKIMHHKKFMIGKVEAEANEFAKTAGRVAASQASAA